MVNVTPIVVIFDRKKDASFTKDDDFFKRVEEYKRKYFTENDFLEDFLDKRINSQAQGKHLWKCISILLIAQANGYIDVDWNRLFSMKNFESFTKIVSNRYDQIKQLYPEICINWDNKVEKKLKEIDEEDKRKTTNQNEQTK